MSDPFDLQRFVDAQDAIYERILSELRAGKKQSHWMWFVFPQFAGLGRSATAQAYAIRSIEEARAYLAHPVLGKRLLECTRIVLDAKGKSMRQMFGTPDDLKFRSCMTLFARAARGEILFSQAIERYFDGKADERTLALLGS